MLNRRNLIALVSMIAVMFARAQHADAQPPQLPPPVALTGDPWGVVLFDIPVAPDTDAERLRVLISDTEGRLLYPATQVREIEVSDEPEPPPPGRFRPGGLVDRVRTAIRGIGKKRKVPVAITVAALFRGDGPLSLLVVGDVEQRIAIQPAEPKSDSDHRRLLESWWKIYVSSVRRDEAGGDHPLLAQKYLVWMLGHRLDLAMPPPGEGDPKPPKKPEFAEPLGSLALLSAIEPLRDEIFEQVMKRPIVNTQSNLPVPQPPRWTAQILPEPPADVVVEPIAKRVPPECFYLRFGSFNNYVWFQDLSARNGGDLAQMVLVRGFNYETSARMERMLNTRMNGLSKMFGDKIIDDMAIVGTDLYMKEGAGLGVLFYTKNRSLLVSNFEGERKQALKNVPGAVLQDIEIGDRKVSFLSTPDNRIRSFLVSDGDYVFLTSSRHLAERFVDLCGKDRSLADAPSFRWARVWMPEANKYSVFAYFSPEFFHSLVAPQFQIELRRRLEAIAHLELSESAARSAAAEGLDPSDVSVHIDHGLLPTWFDKRPDGARTLLDGDRRLDSLRGARGSFVPIADVEISGITSEEAERYGKLKAFYENQWQQMDPMLVGLRRFQSPQNPNREQVAIEAYAAPFEKNKSGWLGDMLGPASPVAIQLPADDVISGQALMNGTAPLAAPRQPYHLFGGVKDMIPPNPEDTQGLIQTLRALKATPGYMGAWPGPGYLDKLPLGLGGGAPDPAGFSRSIIGLWRWQGGGFSILSFDRTIVENTAAQVAPVRAQDAAQVRIRINNLEQSKLAIWINDQWYDRSYRASRGNARLLDTMQEQFKVPGDKAKQAAESLLDVKLNCPLGGEFEYSAVPGSPEMGVWASSAWSSVQRGPDGKLHPPAEYSAPWIKWFRGAQVHLTQFTDRLAIVGTFEIERPPQTEKDADTLAPMNFDLFQLPFKLFGGEAPAAADSKPQKRSF
ncbi:MAG: hypothetical protein U0892_01085 [Pirellulales bacterium]